MTEAETGDQITGFDRLPGDPTAAELVQRMIRVDHAGEYGALRIYDGQLAVLGRKPAGAVIRRMAAQEKRHLETFDEMMVARGVRPTALSPLWTLAGFALGAASALVGETAAMATTVAVETEIDAHYARQAARLGTDEATLKATIEDFRRDERDHRDTALAHGAEHAPAHAALNAAVRAGTRLAIWLSERI